MARYPIQTGRINNIGSRVVLYGPEGIGKTTFAAAFPRPLFIDTEHSTDRYDLPRLPFPTSWAMLMDEVQSIKEDPSQCGTLIIDTADWAERLCLQALLDRTNKSGIEEFGYGKGYTYLAEDFGKLINLLSEVRKCGVHVVLTAHAALRKFEQPDEMGSYDRWELKTSKQVAPMLKEWADTIFFANYRTIVVHDDKTKKAKAQGGQRVMYTQHNPCWDAKNRDGLPEQLPFSFDQVAHLFPDIQGGQTVRSAPAPKPAPVKPAPATPPAATQKAPPAQTVTTTEDDILPTPKAASTEDYKAKQAEKSADLENQLLADGIPAKVATLMAANQFTEAQIVNICANVKGWFPADMRLRDYPADFIDQCIIGQWDKLAELVTECDDVPF